LEHVIKSYLNQEDERLFGRSRRGDPDLEDAEAELERFLRDGETGNRKGAGEAWSDPRSAGGATGGAWSDNQTRNAGNAWSDNRTRSAGGAAGGAWSDGGTRNVNTPPENLRPDFAELGLPFGAGAEDCKAAYKRLLKLHHPDRHAGHEGNMKKATEKTTRINAAYDRIEKWRTEKSGRTR
jgi:DnaJ-domain-containing protein 1